MTPRQLHALRLRQEQKMQREELLFGIVAAATINSGFCAPNKAVSPEAFMLHPFRKTPERAMTGEEIMAAFAAFPMTKAAE